LVAISALLLCGTISTANAIVAGGGQLQHDACNATITKTADTLATFQSDLSADTTLSLCPEAEKEARQVMQLIFNQASQLTIKDCCSFYEQIPKRVSIPANSLNTYTCKKNSCAAGGFTITAKSTGDDCTFTANEKHEFSFSEKL